MNDEEMARLQDTHARQMRRMVENATTNIMTRMSKVEEDVKELFTRLGLISSTISASQTTDQDEDA